MRKYNMAKNTPIKKKEQSKYWYKDKRIPLIFGITMQGIAIFLFLAFFSHYLYEQVDQSMVEAFITQNITIQKVKIQNWLGLLGAICAYYFVFRWFGITAFFIPLLCYILGHQYVYKKKIGLKIFFSFVLFFILWLNIFLGFFYTVFKYDIAFKLLGGIGFFLAVPLYNFLGWGILLLLIVSFIIFIIYFFNVTSLGSKKFFSLRLKKLNKQKRSEKYAKPVLPNENLLYTQKKEIDIEENKNYKPISSVKKNVEKTDFLVKKNDFVEKFSSEVENYDPKLDLSGYKYPTINLLSPHDSNSQVKVTKDELEANKDRIVTTLINFKISIAHIKATIGPTVTLYEIVPEAGIKISKIKNLEDDIALSLAALGIRIIAPIPGKGTIGIEVPNTQKEMVSLRSILATEKFMKGTFELPIALGKTIANEIFFADLACMPHLLIAGATGQGKSVGLNVVLASLLYKKHPSQLKFVLVDPKKVELSLYNKIERHFLAKLPDNDEPIITATKEVIHTLNSLCMEMDNRYELLKEAGVRNIKEYNEKFVQRKLNPQKGHQFLPYIVLVIDEFADMMMTAGKEIELPIARLAQLARAIGIHLVLATQRPSVNVITGIIKANFPVRISFRVTSKIDSRTILDAGGAEQLVGQGDMLVSMNSEIIRLQCPFLDTAEVESVCAYIGGQRGYESAYMLPKYEGEDKEEGLTKNLSEKDDLFEEAAKLIVTHQQGSTSLIQRKLKLGYNRAGRLIDQLETAGIVGPFEGSKAREVLIQDEISLQKLLQSLSKI